MEIAVTGEGGYLAKYIRVQHPRSKCMFIFFPFIKPHVIMYVSM